MRPGVFSFFLLYLSFISTFALRNRQVERKIDLSSHLVKISTDIVIEGDENEYIFTIESQIRGRLSYVEAKSKIRSSEEVLKVKELKDKSDRDFSIELPKHTGRERSVSIFTVFTHLIELYPAEITQDEHQYARFTGNVLYYSRYPTETQVTNVFLPPGVPTSRQSRLSPTPNIISYSKLDPVQVKTDYVSYGPYKQVSAMSQVPFTVHYENNLPFLTVTDITRTIEVSHWGNIAVEEQIDIYHSGAKLRGPFSRYDYQNKRNGISSVSSYRTVLPASARNVYYRDEIGNVTTSHLRELSDSVVVELSPRFPLFGGWRTRYTLGYNVPSYEYLFHKKSQYTLQMRFVDHVFDNMVIDRLTVKVILPELVKIISLKLPYEVERGADEVVHTYLDMGKGRPVVVLRKNNLVENHIANFQVNYEFLSFLMIREPLMVVGAFMLLFASVIIYVRMDFSFTKDMESDRRMRAQSYIEEIRQTLDRRSAVYQSYEDSVSRAKSSKDIDRLLADKKQIDMEHKTLTQKLNSLQQSLKGDSRESSDRVGDIQQLDVQYREQVNQSFQSAEKLLGRSINMATFDDGEQKRSMKKQEILQKIESLLKCL